ncbi:MAG: polysaccharide deacetylase family protein [Candidatus Paceibacterota bacterium]|jgi:peptidoglycan/xylan/chitin deacetylase (PgdA/CDA1 family)|nr:polysaccharide deacetylase family protein [Candidatus Paceibacterota bacterium]
MKKYLVILFVAMIMGFGFSYARASPNLVQNGSFERVASDGFAYEWKKSSWGTLESSFSYPVSGRTGNAVQVSIGELDPFADDHGALIETKYLLSVRPGEKYTYTDYIIGNGTSVYLDIRYTLANGSFLYRGLTSTTTSGVWKKTTVPITVPAGAVAMSVYRVANSAGTFTIDDVLLTAQPLPAPPVGKGFVTFSFDDGRSESSVIPLLKNLGIKGTFFLNPTPLIEQWEPGIVFTLAEVKTLVAHGHEIGNHTLTHSSLIGLAPDELDRQVVGSKEMLESMTGRSVLTFAYPFGDFDLASYALVAANHIGARGVWDSELNTKTSDRYNLFSFNPVQSTPVSQILSLIDQAANSGSWLILSFHQIGPSSLGMYSYQESDLSTVISYAKQKAQIITIRDGLSRYIN